VLREGELRGFDLGVPVFLPLDRDPALVAAGCEQVEHLPDRYFAVAEEGELPGVGCVAGARLASLTWASRRRRPRSW
jgi:hypothetical protein